MKGIAIISLALLIALAAANLQLQVNPRLNLNPNQHIELTCVGNNGDVTYQATGLPAGVTLEGNTLSVSDGSQARDGYYRVNIRAQDSAGQSDQRIIVIIINNNSVQQNSNSQTSSTSPSSSSPSQGSPQSTSPTPQPVVADPGVNDLLDTLSVPNDFTPSDYSAGYPTNNFPTGSDVDIPNFTPQTIASSQAPTSDSNRNTITAEDVRSSAIFQRQFNAAKALANLLSIVKQATANKNNALEQIETYTGIYEIAETKRQNAQLAIEDADRNHQRAQAGIVALNDEVNSLRDTIAQLEAGLKEKELEKDSTQKGLERATEALEDVDAALDAETQRLNEVASEQSEKELECNGLNNELQKAKDQLAARPTQRQRIENDLLTAEQRLKADADLVKALEDRLRDAKASLKNSQANVGNLRQLIINFNKDTAQIQARVTDLTNRYKKCQDELTAISNKVRDIIDSVIPSLQTSKVQIEGQIAGLTEQLNGINQALVDIPNDIKEAQQDLKEVEGRLQYLRGQSIILEKLLREAFIKGNAALQQSKAARQNLDAAIARLEAEEEIIRTATLNLERARIEKEEADLLVDNLLKEGADILPFAAAPDSTGLTEADGIYPITTWNDFIAQAFGVSVKPLFVGDLQTLYSWRFPAASGASGASGAGQTGGDNSACSNQNATSLSGYIIGTSGNTITAMDSNTGAIYNIAVAGCTFNVANQQNYTPQTGDIIVVKGAMRQNNIQATQTACIRR